MDFVSAGKNNQPSQAAYFTRTSDHMEAGCALSSN